MTPASTPSYAGFWLRFLAYCIDGIILAAASNIIASFVPVPANMDADMLAADWRPSVVMFVCSWLYYSLMESSKHQATVGKLALGLRVTDLGGKRIDFLRATGRFFGKVLSGLLIGIGYLMVAFTQKKQGLHDIMAGTLVVRKKA